ncbi:hypothetical protein ACQJBY_025727 [Aegilops geniculata]
MALGGCGNEADGARANHGGSSTGQRQQHGGRPLVWEGNGTANRSGSGDEDANGSGSQRPWKEMAREQRISRSFWMLGSLELMLQIS